MFIPKRGSIMQPCTIYTGCPPAIQKEPSKDIAEKKRNSSMGRR